jgi:hypothetical protein
MRIKKFYNREIRFLFVVLMFLASAVFVSFLLVNKKQADPFAEYLLNADYRALYGYIEKPEFSEEIFKNYVEYNFGRDTRVISRRQVGDNISYKVRTIAGNKQKRYIENIRYRSN